MWYISLLPSIVFHAILAAGLLFIFVSMVLKVVPFVSTYYIPIRIVGFVLFVLGVYFEGGLGIQAAMMEQVKEMEAKVAAAEAESKKENIKIQEKIVYKQQIVREKGAEVIKYIDREIVKYDTKFAPGGICELPKEFFISHNEAAKERR
jgi:hypothetical protein